MNTVSIPVGNGLFASKAALRDHVLAILYKYKFYQPLTGQDDRFMRDFFERHPNREALKAVLPIGHIEVRLNESGARSFFIERWDGSSAEFNIEDCL